MARKVVLLDTNVLVDYYLKQRDNVVQAVELLKKERQDGRCLLFIPIFCVAEVFSTFAKRCFMERKINEETFLNAKWKFAEDVSRDYEYARYQYFAHLPLDRYHLFHAHLVYAPAWKRVLELQLSGKYREQYPSTFDLLVIAQGIELSSLYSDNDFRLLTSDKLMIEICNYLLTLKKEEMISFIRKPNENRGKYKNLDQFRYPKVLDGSDVRAVEAFLKQ